MVRPLVAAAVTLCLSSTVTQAQITKPTLSPTLEPTALIAVQSLTVKDGVISLIGTHGVSATLRSGSFAGPNGSSVLVDAGRITRYQPPTLTFHKVRPRTELPLEVSTVKVDGGQLFLIGTNGRTATLADGTYKSAAGATIVVQNRSIVRVSGR